MGKLINLPVLAGNKPFSRAKFAPAQLLFMDDGNNWLSNLLTDDELQYNLHNLSDTARALILAAQSQPPALQAQLPFYLKTLSNCQQINGLFADKAIINRCEQQVATEVTQAEIFWALASLYAEMPNYRATAEKMLTALLPHLRQLTDLRAMAFAILGLRAYLQVNYNHLEMRLALLTLADQLIVRWRIHRQAGWHWFDQYLGYEAARLPQSLFAAYQISGQERYRTVAREVADWLAEIFFDCGYLNLSEQANCYNADQPKVDFDTMAREAGALVEMYAQAYLTEGVESYAQFARCAFSWYEQINCSNLARRAVTTNACHSALTVQNLTRQQTSSAWLSYHLAWHSLVALNEHVQIKNLCQCH